MSDRVNSCSVRSRTPNRWPIVPNPYPKANHYRVTLVTTGTGAQTEIQSPSAQPIDRGGRLGDELRRPEPGCEDQDAEPHPHGAGRDRGEGGQRLERRDRRRVPAVASERIEEVIGQPDGIEPEVFGAAGPPNGIVEPDPSGREREAVLRERESEAHRAEHTEAVERSGISRWEALGRARRSARSVLLRR